MLCLAQMRNSVVDLVYCKLQVQYLLLLASVYLCCLGYLISQIADTRHVWYRQSMEVEPCANKRRKVA